MKSTLKAITVWIFGVFLSFVLFSLFVEIDVRILGISAASEDIVSLAIKSAWRFNWLFNPAIVFIVALAVSALYKGQYQTLMGSAAVSPLVLLYLVASSFSPVAFAFAGLYIAVTIITALILSRLDFFHSGIKE